jgi:hypothetical protein
MRRERHNGQCMTCERSGPRGTPIGKRTRISARRSVLLLPLKVYVLGWSMRSSDREGYNKNGTKRHVCFM